MPRRECRLCGCHDLAACLHADGTPCCWADEDLCSVCNDLIGNPIFEEIAGKRLRLDAQWGGPEPDDGHDPAEWYGILWGEVDRLLDCGGGAFPDYRERLVKIAAITVAAIEAHDRRAAAAGAEI